MEKTSQPPIQYAYKQLAYVIAISVLTSLSPLLQFGADVLPGEALIHHQNCEVV